MQNKFRRICLFLLLLTLACQKQSPEPITDLISPIHLIAGRSDTLRISDLFYAQSYPLTFLPHPGIDVQYQESDNLLILTPSPELEGVTLLAFEMKGTRYAIPLRVEILESRRFRYTPDSTPQKITLFGSFNSWNRNNLPLTDPDGDGMYEIEISLQPGRYEYKFYVDGEEVLDPANPDKVSNPFGSYNSVITVQPRHSGKAFLHLLGMKEGDEEVALFFHYEREHQPAALTPEEVIALLNNSALSAKQITLRGKDITLRIAKKDLSGENAIRIAVSQNGQTTPFQTSRFWDGHPAGAPGTPFTWNDAILYSIMIDRFYDGDSTNTHPVVQDSLSPKANYMGGDLQGILEKLKEGYFDSLGVNTLWISPVNQNTRKAHREYPPPHRYFSAYHGYWQIDHQKVDDRYGNMELLKKLTAVAHQRGMKVLLDFVAHHVHIDHPFYRAHPDWFGSLYLPDGRKNIRFWDEHRLTTWFEPFLPSFDYVHSDEALQTMTDNAIWWLQQADLDGFRHDAVKHVPNRFWRTLTRKIKQRIDSPQHRKTYQIGETFGSYELVSSYVNNGQLDGQFNFNLFYTARYVFLTPEADFGILANELRKTFSTYGMTSLMANIMDSHDQVRYMAYTDGDITLDEGNTGEIGWNNPPRVDHPASYRKAALYLAYMLTIPGVPTIYYGDEIGMTGASDPDNRRMMRFGSQLLPREREMLRQVRQLVHLRRQHPALCYGDFQTLYADKNCFAYLRCDLNERILVVLNKSEQRQVLTITLPSFYKIQSAHDVMGNEVIPVSEHQLNLSVEGIGWRVLRLETVNKL